MPGTVARVTVADLLARYPGDTEDVARIRALAGSPDAWDRSRPLHLTASALVVHPPTGRILLRWHQRQQAWLFVGGHADPGEADPLAIAIREAREETGLDDLEPHPDGRLVNVAVLPVPASAKEPAHEHADLRFVLATNKPDEARPEKPTAPLRWLTFDEAGAEPTEKNLRG